MENVSEFSNGEPNWWLDQSDVHSLSSPESCLQEHVYECVFLCSQLTWVGGVGKPY